MPEPQALWVFRILQNFGWTNGDLIIILLLYLFTTVVDMGMSCVQFDNAMKKCVRRQHDSHVNNHWSGVTLRATSQKVITSSFEYCSFFAVREGTLKNRYA